MNTADALRFVEEHGVVLESARHSRVPSLAEAVAGGPIHGSWWSHPKGRAIFAATRALREAPDVLVCRVVDGKISFAHERVWPALVKLAAEFPRKDLARKMILLVRQINANFPGTGVFPQGQQVVTCYTCHRGNPHPESLSNRRYELRRN